MTPNSPPKPTSWPPIAWRIGLLENGFNLVAVLPSDSFLPERIAQLQPDMIIVDAESEARDWHTPCIPMCATQQDP